MENKNIACKNTICNKYGCGYSLNCMLYMSIEDAKGYCKFYFSEDIEQMSIDNAVMEEDLIKANKDLVNYQQKLIDVINGLNNSIEINFKQLMYLVDNRDRISK